jgi:hypothetical protein
VRCGSRLIVLYITKHVSGNHALACSEFVNMRLDERGEQGGTPKCWDESCLYEIRRAKQAANSVISNHTDIPNDTL